MGQPVHHGSAVEATLLAANLNGNTDDDLSSAHSSSTETMADVGGSQDEGDVLDDDESRGVDSESTGSLADFIAPDWEMADGEGFLAVEDNDYEDEGSTDNDGIDDNGNGDYDDDRDDGDDRDVSA